MKICILIRAKGTKTQEFSSPHNKLTYSNVRYKEVLEDGFDFIAMFTFCWRNPRNLLLGEDGCRLMINLFCELWKSLMYFSQDIGRGNRLSCFYEYCTKACACNLFINDCAKFAISV